MTLVLSYLSTFSVVKLHSLVCIGITMGRLSNILGQTKRHQEKIVKKTICQFFSPNKGPQKGRGGRRSYTWEYIPKSCSLFLDHLPYIYKEAQGRRYALTVKSNDTAGNSETNETSTNSTMTMNARPDQILTKLISMTVMIPACQFGFVMYWKVFCTFVKFSFPLTGNFFFSVESFPLS